MANGIAAIVIVKKTGGSIRWLTPTAMTERRRLAETAQRQRTILLRRFQSREWRLRMLACHNPAGNSGNYADVPLLSSTEKNGIMEIHFSMLRGSPGFYSTATMTHRKQDERFEVGAWGVVTRVPPSFNWLSADEKRNWFIGVPTKAGVKVPDAARNHRLSQRRGRGIRGQIRLRSRSLRSTGLGLEQRRRGWTERQAAG